MEMEKLGPIDLIERNRLQYFYDRFFMNRIGIRTLIYQHSKKKLSLYFKKKKEVYLPSSLIRE